MTNEEQRLQASVEREVHWKRWGPYLSERQWGTVREDYSANGDAWSYFPHDHARSRAYRWGEDGIGGICDRHQHICFALALWNEKDPILKERLFGLTNLEGNHGEDVKEYYYYLDATPTSSYLKFLYKYPQAAFPYAQLVDENTQAHAPRSRIRIDGHRRVSREPLFRRFRRIRQGHSEDIAIRITAWNRGPEPAPPAHSAHALVSQSLGLGRSIRHARSRLASMAPADTALIEAARLSLRQALAALRRIAGACSSPKMRPTRERLYESPNRTPYVKDAFHRYIDRTASSDAVNPACKGTKAARTTALGIRAGQSWTVRCRLIDRNPAEDLAWSAATTFFGLAFRHHVQRPHRKKPTNFTRSAPAPD